MRFFIEHRTTYHYSAPTFLGPHSLRVLPADSAHQQLLYYQLDIWPQPWSLNETWDTQGNRVHQVTFNGLTQQFNVLVTLEVETRLPPLPFLDASLPPNYGTLTSLLAQNLLLLENYQALEPFIAPLLTHNGQHMESFLAALNGVVHRLYHSGIRLAGPPRAPGHTLALGAGVCRDLALLFMAACRQVGIAARFVSGYQTEPTYGLSQSRQLHAWAEVYAPGIGWQGYDPTSGCRLGDRHVTVAVAALPEDATPIAGSLSCPSGPTTSRLETDVRIRTVS